MSDFDIKAEIKKHIAVAEKAHELWAAQDKETNERFNAVLNGMKLAYDFIEDGHDEVAYTGYLLAISRDYLDSIMSALLRLNLLGGHADLINEYQELLPKAEAVKIANEGAETLRKGDERVKEVRDSIQAKVAKFVDEDEEIKGYKAEAEKIQELNENYTRFVGVASGKVASFEEAQQKMDEYKAKEEAAKPQE